MKRGIARTLLLMGLLALSEGKIRASDDPLVFVVGAGTQDITISSAELRRIFLGRITRWKNGRRIVLAVRPAASAAGHVFFDQVVRMNDIDFSQLWLGIVFRGEAASAPGVVGSAEGAGRFLWHNPDGLIFALSSEIDPRNRALRALALDGKEPADPGYPYVAGR